MSWKERSKPEMDQEELCYLYSSYFENYRHNVELYQEFIKRNRELIAGIFLEQVGLKGENTFHTVHNYIKNG